MTSRSRHGTPYWRTTNLNRRRRRRWFTHRPWCPRRPPSTPPRMSRAHHPTSRRSRPPTGGSRSAACWTFSPMCLRRARRWSRSGSPTTVSILDDEHRFQPLSRFEAREEPQAHAEPQKPDILSPDYPLDIGSHAHYESPDEAGFERPSRHGLADDEPTSNGRHSRADPTTRQAVGGIGGLATRAGLPIGGRD